MSMIETLLVAAAAFYGAVEADVLLQERLTARVSDDCELIVQGRGPAETCWSLACEPRQPVEIGCGLTAMTQVSSLSVSPGRRWLAAISVGEGHPILEVFDLEKLRATRKFEAVTTINPFPGTINLQGWQGEALLVTSDMPLPDLPIPDGDLARRVLSSQQVFSLEPGTWRVRAVP